MALRYLITGATGFIGGHVAEACAGRGLPVATIARTGSDTELLERLGVTILRGDLLDPEVVRKAVEGADVVVHCAAKVGDRGPVEDYRAVNVEALRGLLEACKVRPVHRFVHMSSLGVYEARHHRGTDETEPLPTRHLDGYTQTKVEADELAQRYHRESGVPVVILRPGFVYGPRDRAVMPQLIHQMTYSSIHYLGGDPFALNTIYVGNLVEAVFLAAEQPQAVGGVYNLTDGEYVSKKRFLEAVADSLGLRHPHQRLPRWLAAILRRLLEWHVHRATRHGRKAFLTPAQYKFLLLNLDFSIEKAKRELGYRPAVPFDDAIRRTMAWYKEHPPQP
jgi:nucleoside-diphosphate-sugar epimerase